MIAKDTLNAKQLLRMQMRALFRENQEYDSEAHQNAILSLPEWNATTTILLYSPLLKEPDPRPLMSHYGNKRFYFPRINGEFLEIYRHTMEGQWIAGPFGLREPDPLNWERTSLDEIDLALIPGLAFDEELVRLGRGGGFYDRMLGDSNFRGMKIGLCWQWQLIPFVPREAHDITMDRVITG